MSTFQNFGSSNSKEKHQQKTDYRLCLYAGKSESTGFIRYMQKKRTPKIGSHEINSEVKIPRRL